MMLFLVALSGYLLGCASLAGFLALLLRRLDRVTRPPKKKQEEPEPVFDDFWLSV